MVAILSPLGIGWFKIFLDGLGVHRMLSVKLSPGFLGPFLAIFFAFSCENVAAQDLTISSWGGTYTANQERAYYQPYMALNPDINIISERNASEALVRLQAMNQGGAVSWDLVDVVAADAIRLCDEGLALEIDVDEQLAAAPDGTLPSIDFGDLLVSDCFVPQTVYSSTFGYRTDLVGDNPPTDVCAVFDTKTYPGKRALQRSPTNTMVWALICDGVDEPDVYEVLATDAGRSRAFAKLDTIRDDVVWWSSAAATPQLLADGEIIMGSTYNGRLFSLIEEQNQPVAMLWDRQILDVDGWIIPSGIGSNRTQRALDFLNFATDSQRLADQAQYISYGPARASSGPLIGQHSTLGINMATHMPTDPSNNRNALLQNYEFWADYGPEITEDFTQWLEQEPNQTPDGREFKARVRVLFGTTRLNAAQASGLAAYRSAEHGPIKYGEIEVWVPSTHVIGNVSKERNLFQKIYDAFRGSDKAEDFHLQDPLALSHQEFLRRISLGSDTADRAAFVYIHGFATPFEFAAQRTAQIAYDLQPFKGVPIFFSWPSAGEITPIAYNADENMVEISRLDLANFLTEIFNNEDLETVHIIAHSLGTRLVAEALKEINANEPSSLNKLGEIVLAAPDISALSFKQNFHELFAGDPVKTTVYASSSDYALIASDKWHGGATASIRLGEMKKGTMIFDGIDTIDITDLDGSFSGHSVVQQSRAVLSDLYSIFSLRLRPERRCCLQSMELDEMHFWKMKGD